MLNDAASTSFPPSRLIFLFGPLRRPHLSVPALVVSNRRRAQRSVKGVHFARPGGLVLDGCEHGGRLICVGNDSVCVVPALVVDR